MGIKGFSNGIQNIKKLAKGKIKISWKNAKNSEITMDFNPIIKQFKLSKGLILHYQAKPFGLRRWGIYDITNDKYISIEWMQVYFEKVKIKLLSLEDSKQQPTSVLWIDGRLEHDKKTNKWMIKNG